MESIKIVVLIFSGLALFYASSTRLIKPTKANFLKAYLENHTNELENDIDLVNEIRGVGAVMLLGGIIILLGTIVPNLRQTAFIVAIVILFGVVIGRLISFGIDGQPNEAVIKVMAVEFILGLLNIFCLVREEES